jgi:hypothetical protein
MKKAIVKRHPRDDLRSMRGYNRKARDAYFQEVWKREVLWDYWENPTEENKVERDRVWNMT